MTKPIRAHMEGEVAAYVKDMRRAARCHYDRNLAMRVTTDHRDDCPSQTDYTPGDCPAAGRGCAPCTAPHCLICSREHATNDHPDTCPECQGKVREDLEQLAADYAALAVEAIAGGSGDGRLVAAAPIPGGTAAVLRGPTVRLDQMRVGRGYNLTEMAEVHHKRDPIPPLAVLAQWEDMYRAWFGHTRGARASIAGAVRYLTEQLDHIANGPAVHDGPDWLAFTRQVRHLRATLERALHDEQEPERGVACFECGDRLVRRFRDPARCRHKTMARVELQAALVRQAEGQRWLRIIASYPEIRDENALAAARGPSASLLAAARLPCAACQAKAGGQGGLTDPSAGRSWECPGCRKDYDVGEYSTAVRRDLLQKNGEGWTNVRAAAEAATDVIGMVVTDGLVRKWADRLKVASMCAWSIDPKTELGRRQPQRLVHWPDVVDQANAALERMLAVQAERRAREAQEAAWRRTVLEEVAAGRRLQPAARRSGRQLRIHPTRVAGLLEDLEQELAWRRAVDRGADPVTAAKRLGIGGKRLAELLDAAAA